MEHDCPFKLLYGGPCGGLVRPVEKSLLKLHYLIFPSTSGPYVPMCNAHRHQLGISMKG